MLKYSAKRLLQSLVTIFVVISVVFLLLRFMPLQGYFGENYLKLPKEVIENTLDKYGLLDPLHVQLMNFWKAFIQGDLGESIKMFKGKLVVDVIASKIGYSVMLSAFTLVVMYVIGVPLGVLYAMKKDKFADSAGHLYYVITSAIPEVVLLFVFQLTLPRLLGVPLTYRKNNAASLIVPVFAASFPLIASQAITVRRYMVDQLNQDYIKLAKAKGISNRTIMFKHVFRNVWVYMVRGLANNVVLSISGMLFVERIFSIPGMGGLLVNAIPTQDNTLIQAIVVLFTAASVIAILAGDLLVMFVDPRIDISSKGGEGR